jgi:hypothetical protein
MTDDPKLPSQPATPAPVASKAAVAPPAGDDTGTKAPQSLTFSQHLFIWTMILLVGIIFGVGSTWGVIQQGQTYVDNTRKDVTTADVAYRAQIAERLERNLNPMYGTREFYMYPQYFMRFMLAFDGERNQYAWAEQIRRARMAEAEGLMPTGEALEKIMQKFLAQTGPGNRTYAAILNDLKGGKDEITRIQLGDYLSERDAIQALFHRYGATPVIPDVAGELAANESITVTEVELSADALMPAVADDDVEIATTYDKVKSRFTTPATVRLSVAAPDLAALTKAAATAITDAEIAAHFEAHKATFTKPKAGEAGKTEPKTLDEAKDEIRATLAADKAGVQATEAAERFAETLGADTQAEKDAAAFAAAATKAGMTVTPATLSEQPAGATYTLGALGTISDQAGFFNRSNNPGLITNVMLATGTAKTPFIARLDARTEAGHRSYKDNAEVRSQVKAIIAGRRAWKDFLAKAEAARAAAEQGGLSAWAASEAGKAWKPTLATKGDQGPDRRLAPPPAEADGAPGEARLLAELTLPARPVALEHVAVAAGSTPKLRLVQVVSIAAGKQPAANPRMGPPPAPKETYKRAVQEYQQTISMRRLQDRMEGK